MITSSDQRPLWLPFSDPATDTAATQPSARRLLPVERALFLEPDSAASARGPEVSAARRRLGPGGLAAAVVLDEQS